MGSWNRNSSSSARIIILLILQMPQAKVLLFLVFLYLLLWLDSIGFSKHQNFFNTPSKTVFLDLFKQYSFGRGKSDRKLKDLILFFYGSDTEQFSLQESMNVNEMVRELTKSIWDGKLKKIPEPKVLRNDC